MAEKEKVYFVRVQEATYKKIGAMADAEMRSINSQANVLLNFAVNNYDGYVMPTSVSMSSSAGTITKNANFSLAVDKPLAEDIDLDVHSITDSLARDAQEKAAKKQAEFAAVGIRSTVESSMDIAKGRAVIRVVPNEEDVAAFKKRMKKNSEGKPSKKKIPKGVEPVDSCPHGFAKGFCKKAECNRKYQQ